MNEDQATYQTVRVRHIGPATSQSYPSIDLAVAPDDTLAAITPQGRELLRITGTGEVILSDELRDQPDAAAQAFWAAVMGMNPVTDLAAALARAEAAEARVRALVAAGDRLAEGHTAHDDDCPFPYAIVATDGDCTCGLNAARDAWEQAKEGQDG